MMPRVSVVLSVYNGERYLKECVSSILEQRYADFEFIVINDGSTDSSEEILAGYRDARLKVIRQSRYGLSRSLNRGVRMSTGEYIARMDADDVALPDRLDKQVAFLDAHPEVGMVGTAYYEIDQVGKVVGLRSHPTSDGELRKTLIRFNPFFHSSVMLRGSVFSRVGVYAETAYAAQDYELWFRVAGAFQLANLSEPLVMRRYDGQNISVKSEALQIREAIRFRWRAIRRGQYPMRCTAYLVRPLLVLLTPARFRDAIRRRFLGRGF